MADTVTICFTAEERKRFEDSVKLYNCSVSAMIKRLALEKLEDEMDLKSVNEYESAKRNKTLKTQPLNELWSELNLND